MDDQVVEEKKRDLLEWLDSVDASDSDIVIEGKFKSSLVQTRSHRGSRFRGVSRNGIKYQVMIVFGQVKKYIGAIGSEETAGRLYDKYALIMQGC